MSEKDKRIEIEWEEEGWSEWHIDREGNEYERYWEPGMRRMREVWNGHISYGPYITFGKDEDERDKKNYS